jgi:hypothetical protein
MKKALMTGAVLTVAFSPTSKVLAQALQHRTEVCVDASDLAEARRRFPNARFHVLPDFAASQMNDRRRSNGTVRPDKKITTDAEKTKLRQQKHHFQRE